MPTMSANAKSFSVSPPKKKSAMTGSSVQSVVASERSWAQVAERIQAVKARFDALRASQPDVAPEEAAERTAMATHAVVD